MNLGTIREGLETTLSGVPGLRVYGSVPDNPTVPCAVVIPDSIQYAQDFDGTTLVRLVVQVLTPSVNTIAGQATLDDFCSVGTPHSIYDQIEANPTLAGSCQDAHVTDLRSYGTVGDAIRYYGADLVVEVYA